MERIGIKYLVEVRKMKNKNEYYCLFYKSKLNIHTLSENIQELILKTIQYYGPWTLSELIYGRKYEDGRICFYMDEKECNFEVKKIKIEIIEDDIFDKHRKKLGDQEEV